MKGVGVIVAALIAVTASVTANAASYLDGTPLGAQVKTSVRDCRTDNKWQVPVITWGADEVTVNANGGLRTQAGTLFAKHGLDITLKREDKFEEQVKSYLTCDSPFLRATLGMAAQAADLTEGDSRTKMVAIYQHSWSAGGDALVARDTIKQPQDLKGKTVVVQRYGPHVDYLMKVLADAGLKPSDVKIKWVKDLTGKSDSTPAEAFRADGSIDAAMMISPDAAVLTSDNTVGTGSEGSVKGAHTLLSTKSANRIITDIYFVRKDFYDANKDKLAEFVKGLLESEEETRAKARTNGGDWGKLMKLSAKLLLDDESAVEDAKGLWGDAETTGRQGNAKFFADFNYPRSFGNVSREVQSMLRDAGQQAGTYRLTAADWDWQALTNIADVSAAGQQRFDTNVTNRVVSQMHEQGKIDNDTLFSFEIQFQPNQKDFQVAFYRDQFDRVINLASTYSGAVITIEGHADPMGYLRKLQDMEKSGTVDKVVISRMVQAARNLSVQRSQQVRDTIIEHGKAKGVTLDPSQFVTVGMGYESPKTGICGDRPCAPKNEKEWLSNMRVQFRIVNVEAESSAFVPLR
jgi:ABC-type nitrate/sulfonate/bicarbonate transport system substrate-binding protein